MIYATATSSPERVTATPGGEATCPMCDGVLIPKCGKIVSWHWAHKACDCDTWGEGESNWHIEWKERFPKEWQECVVSDKYYNQVHRADVMTPSHVVEFQRSHLPEDEIGEREHFYTKKIDHYGNNRDFRKMVWVIDAQDFYRNMTLRYREVVSTGGVHSLICTFRWRWPRKSWWIANHPVYLDFGTQSKDPVDTDGVNHATDLLLVEHIYPKLPCGGWGRWVNREDFISRVSKGEPQRIML